MTDDLGKYLGVPLIHSRVNRSTYQYIIEKIRGKFKSWKDKKLALAGRIILAQSVITTTPIYVMQNAYLPASICDEIDKLYRRFIWGNSRKKEKILLVNWHSVQHPKESGGLGIRSAKSTNHACMMKLA